MLSIFWEVTLTMLMQTCLKTGKKETSSDEGRDRIESSRPTEIAEGFSGLFEGESLFMPDVDDEGLLPDMLEDADMETSKAGSKASGQLGDVYTDWCCLRFSNIIRDVAIAP